MMTVHAAHRLPHRISSNRRALMLSCASLAVAAAALAPQRASAQSAAPAGAFRGNINSTVGTVTRAPTTNSTETITIGSPTATINWSPTDTQGVGTVDFLPAGNTATFTSSTGVSDYTVLNRVVPNDPSRPIALNGSVLSKIGDTGSTGGNIWFYSPAGIIVGSQALFDVGSLLLTTNDVSAFSTSSGGFTAHFARGDNVTGAVQIMDGAQIRALQENSYVALVAPRIEQGGKIEVNGSAAFAAAEQLSMTMNQGLFDISVDAFGGTADANGVVHTGTTTGPASTGLGGDHKIYMVAVPKNQALTMLLGGTGGFAPAATNVTVRNGEIVLSAGASVHDLNGRVVSTSTSSTGEGNILVGSMGATSLTSDVWGHAKGTVGVLATSGNVDLSGDLLIRNTGSSSDGSVALSADSGYALTVDGNVSLSNDYSQTAPRIGISASGGNVTIGGTVLLRAGRTSDGSTIGSVNLFAFNGALTIGGATTLYAATDGVDPDLEGGSFDRHGGTATVEAYSGGSITTGELNLDVHARGDLNSGNGGLAAGDGTGGNANITADGGGSVLVQGLVSGNADGSGGDLLGGGTYGANGYGGSFYLSAREGSSITVEGILFASASGTGSSYTGSPSTNPVFGGDGRGGSASIQQSGGSVSLAGGTNLIANGAGGDGQYGGYGYGGSAGIDGASGSAAVGDIELRAQGFGGAASIGFGGSGGSGQGGVAYIQADAFTGDVEVPPSAASISGGTASLNVSGVGGDGGNGDGATISAGYGGSGQAGLYNGTLGSGGAFVLADAAGGSLNFGAIDLIAVGTGGDGGVGGTGQVGGVGGYGYGGTAQAGSSNPSGVTDQTGTATFGNVSLNASAFGGNGGAGTGAAAGNGGAAYGGGNISCTNGTCGGAFLNAKGAVTAGSVSMAADAHGGDGEQGGSAVGGVSLMESYANSELNVISASLSARAYGATGNSYGGHATGGMAAAGADATSTLHVTNNLQLSADALGGAAADYGGDGDGGTAHLEAVGGTLHAGNVALDSNGTGGAANIEAGWGWGGTSEVVADSGTIKSDQAILARAQGKGATGITTAGNGIGGEATLDTRAAGNVSAAAGAITLDASAVGGSATDTGGQAFGGDAILTADGGSASASGNIVLNTRSDGGSGTSATSSGGEADGGSSTLNAMNGGAVTAGALLNINSAAFGGAGIATGGDAFAGWSEISIDGGSVTANKLGHFANAWGGQGTTAGLSYGGATSLVYGASGGSLSIATAGEIEADGFGAAGIDGHDGGAASGGSVEIDISTAGTATFGSFYADATGVGGAGGAADVGGLGGNGDGGSIDVNIAGTLTSSGKASLYAYGRGGAGGAGISQGGKGGAASGGDISADISGTMNVDAMEAIARAYGGDGGAGAILGDGGSAEGGYSILSISGTVTTPSGLFVNATSFSGEGANGGEAYGGYALADISGTVTTGDLEVTAQGFGGEGSSGMGGAGYGGTSEVTIDGTVITAAAFMGNGGYGGAGTTAGGDGSGGAGTVEITSGSFTGTDNFVMQALGVGGQGGSAGGSGNGGLAAVLASNGGSFKTAGLSIVADGTAGAGGGTTAGTAGQVFLVGLDGGLLDLGTASLTARGTDGSGSILFELQDGIQTAALAGAQAEAPPTSRILASALTTDTTGDVALLGTDGSSVTVSGALDLEADGTIGVVGSAISAGSLTLSAHEIYSSSDLAGDSVTINAADGAQLGNIASATVTVTAGGTATFGGIVAAPTITVTSADLDVSQGAKLGVFGTTNDLTLNAMTSGSPVVIGSEEADTGSFDGSYILSEAGDIQAKNLTINVNGPEGGHADLYLFGVDIDGTQSAEGGFAGVTLNTAGSILVKGAVQYHDVAGTDALTLHAGEKVIVEAARGSVAMTGTDGALSGSLNLAASSIWAADDAVLAQLQADPNFSGRETALATNSGTANAGGYLQSATISASFGNAFLAQNSGSATDVAGISAGPGGLVLNSSGTAPALVIAFGRKVNADGTIIGGDNFVPTVQEAGTAGFVAASTINNCALAGCVAPPPPPPEEPPPVVSEPLNSTTVIAPGMVESPTDASAPEDPPADDQDEDADDAQSDDATVNASLGLINTSPVHIDVDIDDPVTSGGDAVVDGPGGAI